MYKSQPYSQIAFEDFNQPMGLKMNSKNRWIEKAEWIPWAELEKDYAKNLRNKKGNVAKPLRMALGALLIQIEYGYSDEETVLQIQENPYLQFFIGLPGYQEEKPFDSSTMVYFRKRLDAVTLTEINEKITDYALVKENRDNDNDDDTDSNDSGNAGTLILDATCAPQKIKYPTDTELLNEARTHAEKMVDDICETSGFSKPRMYRKKARKDYLSIVRRKRKSAKWLRPKIRKLLGYVRRDIDYIKGYLEQGIKLNEKQQKTLNVICRIYDQQKEMFDKKMHSVKDRIVSFSQPWLRPIVRGKAKTKVEFGEKLDLSIDSNGMARIEKTSFDAYNEASVLVQAVRRFYDRNGCYPERVLADKIYRNRENRSYCKARGIRLAGPSLGRPKKDQTRDKKIEYHDNADRVAVERSFSLLKRCFGMENIRTKLRETTLTTIALSVIAMNVANIHRNHLRSFFSQIKNRIKSREVLLNFPLFQICLIVQ